MKCEFPRLDYFPSSRLKLKSEPKNVMMLSTPVGFFRGSAPTPYHLVRWCPFIPDGDDQLSNCLEEKGTNGVDQRYNRILLVTAGHMAEIWSVDEVEQV